MTVLRAWLLLTAVLLLPSCATILDGYYDDVEFHGARVPLVFIAPNGDTIPSNYDIIEGKVVNSIRLDKRVEEHRFIARTSVDSFHFVLSREPSYYWLIPNLLTWETGFVVDYVTKAAYHFPDQYVTFRNAPDAQLVTLPKYDSVIGTISAFFGVASPSVQPPQGPNACGASVGLRYWKHFTVGVDASFTGTADKEGDGPPINMYSPLFGLALSYYPTKRFYIAVQPTLQRVSYRRSS